MFEAELAFFMENQQALVRLYGGRFLVLAGRRIIGDYPTALSALLEAQKTRPLGTFMIQRCIPGPEAYTTEVYSPRVGASPQ